MELAEIAKKYNEMDAYDSIIESLQKCKESGTPIEEGVVGAIAGMTGAMVFGPKIMTAVCQALGIDQKGALGSLMTSRLILTAVAGKLGWRL